jgi:L-ribulokinase
MASPVCKTYVPNAQAALTYEKLYANYQQLAGYVNGAMP